MYPTRWIYRRSDLLWHSHFMIQNKNPVYLFVEARKQMSISFFAMVEKILWENKKNRYLFVHCYSTKNPQNQLRISIKINYLKQLFLSHKMNHLAFYWFYSL